MAAIPQRNPAFGRQRHVRVLMQRARWNTFIFADRPGLRVLCVCAMALITGSCRGIVAFRAQSLHQLTAASTERKNLDSETANTA